MFINPNLIEPLTKRGQKSQPADCAGAESAHRNAKLMETKKTDFAATTNYGPALMQKMSTIRPLR